jgi:hypothetical protein
MNRKVYLKIIPAFPNRSNASSQPSIGSLCFVNPDAVSLIRAQLSIETQPPPDTIQLGAPYTNTTLRSFWQSVFRTDALLFGKIISV